MAKLGDRLGHVVLAHDVEPLLEDDLALVIHHVVVLQDLLADVEVALLDLLLRGLERLVHPRVRDRLAFLEAERLQHLVHALRPEDAHQIVVEREIELRTAGVALTARAAAQLIVDAPALVALGREHVEAAGIERPLLLVGDVGCELDPLLRDRGLVGRRALFGLLRDPVAQTVLGVAAELNIGAAAGHVGCDRHGTRNAGLGDDARFLLVIARVQEPDAGSDRLCPLAFDGEFASAAPPCR